MRRNLLLGVISVLFMLNVGCAEDSSNSFGANQNPLSLVDTDTVWNISIQYNECVKLHEEFYLERDTLDQEQAMAMYQAMASYPVELYPACENEIVDAVNDMLSCSLSKGLCGSPMHTVKTVHEECGNSAKVVKAAECMLREAKEVVDYESLMDGYCRRSHECARDKDTLDDSFSYDECMERNERSAKDLQKEEQEGKYANGCYNLYLQIHSDNFKINQKMYEANKCEGVFYDEEDTSKMSFMREEHLYSMMTIDTVMPFYKAVCKYSPKNQYIEIP